MSAAVDARESLVPVAPAGEATRMTALIVDVDGVSRRFLELALEKDGTFQVESALDGAGALEILAHTQVHAIIADTELIDMNGLQLHRRLATESRLRDIPFLFQSSDRRTATRILAFEEGVDDFLVKPCDVGELVARVKAAVERRRRALAAARRRSYVLAGRFSALSFPDLVSILEQSRRSGTLAVVGERSAGAVYFDTGNMVHASFGNLVGQRAFQALMELDDAQFEFTQEACTLPLGRRSMRGPVTGLILEAARLIDTRNHEHGPPAGAGPGHTAGMSQGEGELPPRSRPRSTSQSLHLRRAQSRPPLLSPGVASQLIHGIGDGFTLGDLCIYDRTALSQWITSEGGRHRFHVHLLADASEAASALLALSGSPSERMVVGSLSPEAKALGLTFSLRHELLIDLVHLDIASPSAFAGSLVRVPSLLLVAPPGGDVLAIGTKARVELEQMFARAAPTAVLGVGGRALESALRSLPALREHTHLCTVEGALGIGGSDLRTLLIEGIRLCTAEETP